MGNERWSIERNVNYILQFSSLPTLLLHPLSVQESLLMISLRPMLVGLSVIILQEVGEEKAPERAKASMPN